MISSQQVLRLIQRLIPTKTSHKEKNSQMDGFRIILIRKVFTTCRSLATITSFGMGLQSIANQEI